MALRRFNRKIKSLAAKGRPGAINRHIIRTEKIGNVERCLHATKGWRVRAA